MAQAEWKFLIEELARRTVGAALGVAIGDWDRDGRQNAPDGRFVRRGCEGFVEATTHANSAARAGRVQYRAEARCAIDGVGATYHVWIDPVVPREEHGRFVPPLIRAMEQMPSASLTSVVESLEPDDPEAARWAADLVEAGRLEVRRWGSGAAAGTVFTTASLGRGGSPIDDDPNAILEGIASMTKEPSVERRLNKLERAGGAESYLFVEVDNDMWTLDAWSQLVDVSESRRVPTRTPDVPRFLDGLWVWSSLNRYALRWLRSSGWRWQAVELPPGVSWGRPLPSLGASVS